MQRCIRMSDSAGRTMFLRLTGLAVATCASALGQPPGFEILAGMALALCFFAAAERLEPSPPSQLGMQHAIQWSRSGAVAVVIGILLCLFSAYAVSIGLSLYAQHLPWALSFLLFAVPAVSSTSPRFEPIVAHLSRFDWQAIALLLLFCTFVFGWNFPSWPVEVHGDEVEVGFDALRLLEERGLSLFSTGWYELPILHAGPTALSFTFFGADLFALRFSSVVLGTATVLLVYASVRRLCGSKTALAAALILAGQRYFIHISRSGFHYIDTPFLSILVLYLALRTWQDRRPGSALWCGVVIGLSMHTYFASRIIPIVLALTTAGIAIGTGRRKTRAFGELCLIALVALAVAAPLFAHFAQNWDALWSRTRETSLFEVANRIHMAENLGSESLNDQLWAQATKALAVFHSPGDTSVQFGLHAPMLDFLSGVLIVAGIGTALARPLHPAHLIAILWIFLPLMTGGALTVGTPFYPRLSGIVPFAAIAIAIGWSRSARAISQAFSIRNRGVIAMALLAGMLALNGYSYFGHYVRTYRHSPLPEITSWILQQGRGFKTYLFDEQRHISVTDGVVAFLAAETARENVDDPDAFFARPIDRQRSRFIITPSTDHVLPRLEQHFGPLETETLTNEHGQVRVHTARPKGAKDAPLEARNSPVQRDRILPWLSLLAALGVLGGLASWRRRRTNESRQTTLLTKGRPSTMDVSNNQVHTADPQGNLPRWAIALALATVLLLASWLRLAKLDEMPAGFYCDEAGNAYNAASILRSGRDETGTRFPLYVWSFDTSYKNPVFIYAATIPTAIFGATPFAARFTSAAFGIAAVIGIFFLGRAIGGASVGLFAALFLAVVPWHLHFSRIAFELIALPTFFIAGTTALVLFTQGRRTLPWAACAFAVSLYTYVPAKMLTPIFLAFFALIFHRQLWQRRRETLTAALLFTLLAVPLAHFDIANLGRAGSYFRDTSYLYDDTSITDKALQAAQNYSHFYSPAFLFQNGDRIIRHAVRDHGELYPAMAPLMLLGLIAICRARSPGWVLILVWLVIYPLAAIFIRREIPSATRAILGAPAFCLIAAAGADWIWRWAGTLARPRLRTPVIQALLLLAGLIILGAQVARYWSMYSDDYPTYAARFYTGFQHGHKEAVDYLVKHADDYDRLLLTTSHSNQPEIFLRYFAGLLQNEQPGAPPFERPAKMDRGNPEDLHLYQGRTLFAAVAKDLLYFADYDIAHTVRAPDGSPSFFLVDLRQPKHFIHVWKIAGPYPIQETPPLPTYDPADPPQQERGRPWRRYQLRKAPIYFRHHFGSEPENSCAWAVNFVYLDEPQSGQIMAGFDDSGEVWINGEKIELRGRDNAFFNWIDTSIGKVELNEGRNSIAIKACNIGGGWRFYFRLADAEGKNLQNLDWEYVHEEGL